MLPAEIEINLVFEPRTPTATHRAKADTRATPTRLSRWLSRTE